MCTSVGMLSAQQQLNSFVAFFQDCTGTQFVVQGELVQCGLTGSETCLKSVTLGLSGGANVSMIQTQLMSMSVSLQKVILDNSRLLHLYSAIFQILVEGTENSSPQNLFIA